MKKSDWLVAIFIIAMGMMCLIISATSFRNMSFLQVGSWTGGVCFLAILVGGIISLVYYSITKKYKD